MHLKMLSAGYIDHNTKTQRGCLKFVESLGDKRLFPLSFQPFQASTESVLRNLFQNLFSSLGTVFANEFSIMIVFILFLFLLKTQQWQIQNPDHEFHFSFPFFCKISLLSFCNLNDSSYLSNDSKRGWNIVKNWSTLKMVWRILAFQRD